MQSSTATIEQPITAGGAKGYTDYSSLAQERGETPPPCVGESWR
jgi:hypothetical protein